MFQKTEETPVSRVKSLDESLQAPFVAVRQGTNGECQLFILIFLGNRGGLHANSFKGLIAHCKISVELFNIIIIRFKVSGAWKRLFHSNLAI